MKVIYLHLFFFIKVDDALIDSEEGSDDDISYIQPKITKTPQEIIEYNTYIDNVWNDIKLADTTPERSVPIMQSYLESEQRPLQHFEFAGHKYS